MEMEMAGTTRAAETAIDTSRITHGVTTNLFVRSVFMSSLRVNPMVVVSLSRQQCLAYHIDTNQLRRLNSTAALLIELCDGRSFWR